MKKVFTFILGLVAVVTAIQANTYIVIVKNTKCQTVTGFGAACCDGAMLPYGDDTQPVKLLYGPSSKVGLNIMRMEISPSFTGDNWGDYDWRGSLPSAKYVKLRGGIVFGTPWSPPGEYKTNGSASGGKVNTEQDDDPQNQKGALRDDCYEKFFPWINTFLKYMRQNGVKVDAVSVQNEPDWWVNYSGCLYTPQQQLTLVKNYAKDLDREKYPGVRLISAEPLGFDPSYSNALLNDPVAREQVDIIAGHIYGHPPFGNAIAPPNMKNAAVLSSKYGKELWMTEHSVNDGLKDRLPNWSEQLEFARELNECMQAGCTGYIYWYMRAHWSFIGTGESQYGADNKRNKLLPRAYVMSHFSKHVTGSTRLDTKSTLEIKTNADIETTAYIKGDSLIVMAINSTAKDHTLKLKLPSEVASGTHLISTGNELENLCQEQAISIDEPMSDISVSMPANSLNTYIFMIDDASTAITDVTPTDDDGPKTYYDLQGRRVETPHGLCIEKSADGFTRKVYIRD